MKSRLKSLIQGRSMPIPAVPDEGSASPGKALTDGKASQLVLMNQYRALAATPGAALPSFRDVGFRQYSQFEEDGILLYLFSLLSPINRSCVEICAGDGIECNTANLIVNHGWWGLLFDGNEANVEKGRQFYARNKDTFLYPPRFKQAWLTAENINDLLVEQGVSGAVDLLSLDIDGNDYWMWEAITAIDPMVVVCEVNNAIPPNLALTIPYDPGFAWTFGDDFVGASLGAMVQLGKRKGYRLVGTHRYGFNAFFVKNGIGETYFPEVTPESCATDPYTREALRTRWPKIEGRNWVQV